MVKYRTLNKVRELGFALYEGLPLDDATKLACLRAEVDMRAKYLVSCLKAETKAKKRVTLSRRKKRWWWPFDPNPLKADDELVAASRNVVNAEVLFDGFKYVLHVAENTGCNFNWAIDRMEPKYRDAMRKQLGNYLFSMIGHRGSGDRKF